MSEMNEFKLRVPSDLTRRFRGLSIDIGTLYVVLIKRYAFAVHLSVFGHVLLDFCQFCAVM